MRQLIDFTTSVIANPNKTGIVVEEIDSTLYPGEYAASSTINDSVITGVGIGFEQINGIDDANDLGHNFIVRPFMRCVNVGGGYAGYTITGVASVAFLDEITGESLHIAISATGSGNRFNLFYVKVYSCVNGVYTSISSSLQIRASYLSFIGKYVGDWGEDSFTAKFVKNTAENKIYISVSSQYTKYISIDLDTVFSSPTNLLRPIFCMNPLGNVGAYPHHMWLRDIRISSNKVLL